MHTAYAQLHCSAHVHVHVHVHMCTNCILLIHALRAHFPLQEAVQLLLRVMEPSARAGWQARSAAEFFLAGGLTAYPAQLADADSTWNSMVAD